MVGNALFLTGTGLTTGFYFVTAFTSATAITLDRSPGTGTTGAWSLGGGWADFWTNTASALAYIVAGNIIYILGGASPSYGSPDYTSSTVIIVSGVNTVGLLHIFGDPTTPSGNGFAGYPLIKGINTTMFSTGVTYIHVKNLFIFASANVTSTLTGTNSVAENCIYIYIYMTRMATMLGL